MGTEITQVLRGRFRTIDGPTVGLRAALTRKAMFLSNKNPVNIKAALFNEDL